MSENEPKPGVVIDVTPDPERATGDGSADAARDRRADGRKPGRRGTLAMLLAVIALAGVAVTVVLGYGYWSGLKADLAAMDASLRDARGQQAQLRASLAEAAAALRAQKAVLQEQGAALDRQRDAVEDARTSYAQQERTLADENLRLQEREAQLRAAVADVHRRVGMSGTQWMVAETEYLLRVASHRLALARDIETARVALELADQRLRDTRDPGWAGVRARIARDIAQLNATQLPDLSGLAARLAALIEQVPQLKVARATVGAERTLPERVAREPDERSWNTLLGDVWAGFKDSVRIRERDTPVQAMLAPEHEFFLYENLRLHLEAARLGLVYADPDLFRDNLATADDWLARFFDPADATTQALRQAIADMRAVEIRPELPDISRSLRALEARLELVENIGTDGAGTP